MTPKEYTENALRTESKIDNLWYMAVALDVLGTDLETVMEANIAKLRARFPEKFEARQANERDLEAEAEASDEVLR